MEDAVGEFFLLFLRQGFIGLSRLTLNTWTQVTLLRTEVTGTSGPCHHTYSFLVNGSGKPAMHMERACVAKLSNVEIFIKINPFKKS